MSESYSAASMCIMCVSVCLIRESEDRKEDAPFFLSGRQRSLFLLRKLVNEFKAKKRSNK